MTTKLVFGIIIMFPYQKVTVYLKILKPVIDKAKIKLKWLDEFYQNSNNPENFNYKNLNKLVFKSKKLSRYDINDKILFDGSYLIAADTKGNIILYSIEQKNIIYTFNFYKKKFKKIKKKT